MGPLMGLCMPNDPKETTLPEPPWCAWCGGTCRCYQWDEVLEEFGLDLAAKQQPLGEPFSTILHKALWDLYVRS